MQTPSQTSIPTITQFNSPGMSSLNASVQVGQPAPGFKCTAVVDGRFKEVALSAYIEAQHWLILIFFPKAWSFICPTEIRAFSARLEEFLYSRSCAVVFCSTDSEHCLKAWNATSDLEGGLGGVHVPLMSDCNHRVSKDYGVLIESEGVAQRALFIIDPKGILRSITTHDADVGRSVDETQRVLDALVFKDEFGEGCPVDWKKGDKGIDTKTNLEGRIELKKSWSEWARPKLQRAWSGTSQRSIGSIMSSHQPSRSNLCIPPDGVQLVEGGSSMHSRLPSGPTSPSLPPTSNPLPAAGFGVGGSGLIGPLSSPVNGSMQAQMEHAMEQQRLENLRAAMENNGLGVGIAN